MLMLGFWTSQLNVCCFCKLVFKKDKFYSWINHFYYFRLLQQIPKKMQEKASSWSHHVYGLLGHGAVKVREKALQALTLALPALLQNPNGLIPTMVTDVKTVRFFSFPSDLLKLNSTPFILMNVFTFLLLVTLWSH